MDTPKPQCTDMAPHGIAVTLGHSMSSSASRIVLGLAVCV
jgi:hypothetical protein